MNTEQTSENIFTYNLKTTLEIPDSPVWKFQISEFQKLTGLVAILLIRNALSP